MRSLKLEHTEHSNENKQMKRKRGSTMESVSEAEHEQGGRNNCDESSYSISHLSGAGTGQGGRMYRVWLHEKKSFAWNRFVPQIRVSVL